MLYGKMEERHYILRDSRLDPVIECDKKKLRGNRLYRSPPGIPPHMKENWGAECRALMIKDGLGMQGPPDERRSWV